MKAELLFLGTGASSGIPLIGCTCAVCNSSSHFNRRLRPSALIRAGGKQILIDAGPDLREQALKHKVVHLDGVLLTHTHFDHIGGIDDLRVYYFEKHHPLPCLVSKETYDEIRVRIPYLFQPPQAGKSLAAQLAFELCPHEFGKVDFQELPFHFVSYYQGAHKVLGFRLGDLAFISDIREYTPRVIEEIRGVKTLVVSALRKEKSLVHFNFDEAIAFSKAVGATKTWFTHISHDVDHEIVSKELPPNFHLAYDGLSIEFDAGFSR